MNRLNFVLVAAALFMLNGCVNMEKSQAAKVDASHFYRQSLQLWYNELCRRMISDEQDVPPYTLKEIEISTLENWEKIQKPEIKKFFEDDIYGKLPPRPDQIEFELLREVDNALGNTAIRREIRINMSMKNQHSWYFDVLLYIPKNIKGKAPLFIGLNFDGNQQYSPELDIRKTFADRGGKLEEIPDSYRGQYLDKWNYTEAVKQGFAVATACYGEIFPDQVFGAEKSIYTLFYPPEKIAFRRPLVLGTDLSDFREFGAISAWAWGISRIIDLAETQQELDSKKIAVVGHSRLGKAAIWAGVNDERVALTISNNSGCMGAAPSKRLFGETFDALFMQQPHWFSENAVKYVWRSGTMPYDQYHLMALIAPRKLYVASSSEDWIADPYGEFISAKMASKVWKLYQLEGLECEEQPPLDTSVGSQVGYHVKNGKHCINSYDWQQYYNFLNGKKDANL